MFKRSQYRLLGLVGQGQFGRVFCAVHRQTGRLVALKRLDHQRFSTAQFLRELRFLLSLRHENIVACRSIEHAATGRHLVMDYCEGGTLRGLMTEEVRLSLPQSIKLVTDVLEGLAHAHDRGIIHCDIKPENILLTVQPQGWTAKISDFGIARLSQAIEGRETENTGSPAYMAPERFYGNYSPTSDLYSVGILLHELLAGYRPFSGTPAELRDAHLNQSVKLPDAIPAVWQPLIATALQKLSARRWQSAEEMLVAIRAIDLEESLPQKIPVPLLQAIHKPPDCVFQVQHQQPAQPVTALAVSDLPQLLALDQRHLAIVSDAKSSQASEGTLITILTRRGKEIGSLLLPLRIDHPILTPIPYQLLAIDRDHPELLALIDLKPYRIKRMAAGIIPDFLSVTDWGYIVANRQGEISLLDLEGRQVGIMTAPAAITAIAPFEQHGLWVATWAGDRGWQSAIDLREIGADLLF